jgi:hypothetical protein
VELSLHAWVYKIETGQVFVYSTQERQFRVMSQNPAEHPPAPTQNDTLLDGRFARQTTPTATDVT